MRLPLLFLLSLVVLLNSAHAADTKPNITVRIVGGTMARPNDPNYLTRCALVGHITNDSPEEIESIEIKLREHLHAEIGIKSGEVRSAFFAGFFGSCDAAIKDLNPQVTNCRFHSATKTDCKNIVEFELH